ncbi:D-alanyl-D-alanine carboxypeptidase family protein [Velocimicrobium porci]|uniref:D-alanyl-D-alanine carboxypeptidase n=1 Tax=Velocimicrobium porci TaxID=2606634 RepID=A0A6L5Y075_9FIRM|nr:D-alanyl-D-alanine carboxypeptidase family protein [Velocimicrobium porci]MSS64382.1 D-alanyl-D-alanine carboxypeptidase [Velocimicrobium porci]
MKYKRGLCILLAGILLTGCSSNTMYNEFEDGQQIIDFISPDSSEIQYADSFAKDLCVVPVNYQNKKDPFMTAKASLIFDVTDHKILYADNVYERLYPASVTKIVTSLIALEECDLNEMVTISHNAANITEWGAKKCGFQEGDQIKLKDLLYSFLIYSGNDAGIAIAEHISGSVEAFAEKMNQKAKELGAVDSHFVNPHGLHDDNHYTTIYDIYLFFEECIKNKTFLDIINTKGFTAHYKGADGKSKTAFFPSTNRYLVGREQAPENVTVIGGKTGTTSKAGSCLTLYSKNSNGHDYISIIFHASTGNELFAQMTRLLEYESK